MRCEAWESRLATFRPPIGWRARPRTVLTCAYVAGCCVVSSLLRHLGVMASEALARAGAQGRLVVLEARVGPKGWGVTGCRCPQR